MKHFLQHLKNKGYSINQGIAMLYGVKFRICTGYKNTARGKQKPYWLELNN